MTRAWLVDLLAAMIGAAIVTAVVALLGGPLWAAAGFGLLYYLLRPTNAQERQR
jgi:Flp pilus assembly protein TadB